MADKKLEKALYGPSVTEVALGAVLGLIVGVVAACAYLVFKPVLQVKELPKEPVRSVVYFIPGSENSAKSRGWQAKEKLLIDGKGITLNEDELNAWASSLGAPSATAPSAAKPAAKPAPNAAEKPKAADKPDDSKNAPADSLLVPSAPNFRIIGDRLQIGMKCTLNWAGMTYDVTVQATGVFRKAGEGFEFAPDKVYLGSCPLHLVPAASGFLISSLMAKQKISDDLRVALTKLTAVTVEGGALKLAMQ
jgi:hypothetical protein